LISKIIIIINTAIFSKIWLRITPFVKIALWLMRYIFVTRHNLQHFNCLICASFC